MVGGVCFEDGFFGVGEEGELLLLLNWLGLIGGDKVLIDPLL